MSTFENIVLCNLGIQTMGEFGNTFNVVTKIKYKDTNEISVVA